MRLIKNYSELATSKPRKIVLDLIETALSSIQPQKVMNKNFKLEGSILKIRERKINLENYERIFLLGFGKGCAQISKIIESVLKDRLTKGFVIDTSEDNLPAGRQGFEKIEFVLGTHPLPSRENIEFTQKTIEQLNNLTIEDLVLIVIAGGGSVLFEKPFSISLERLIEINDALLRSGADIFEMNTVRKHLSQTKGGGLAKILFPAKVYSLIFSDVPGNDLSTIASGPTALDETTKEDALRIIEKYKLEFLNLNNDDFTETPKEDEIFKNVENVLMLSNLTALDVMKKKAIEMNIKAEIYSDKFQSEADLAGKALIEKTQKNSVLLVGGETTVRVRSNEGKGGRNQELVLSTLYSLDENTVIASFDSDGWDNSPSAGAIGDFESLEKAKKLELNPHEFLNANNSLVFFKNIRDAIITGRLPSNVSDLIIVYRK